MNKNLKNEKEILLFYYILQNSTNLLKSYKKNKILNK